MKTKTGLPDGVILFDDIARKIKEQNPGIDIESVIKKAQRDAGLPERVIPVSGGCFWGGIEDLESTTKKRDIVDRIFSLAAFHGWEVDTELLEHSLRKAGQVESESLTPPLPVVLPCAVSPEDYIEVGRILPSAVSNEEVYLTVYNLADGEMAEINTSIKEFRAFALCILAAFPADTK